MTSRPRAGARRPSPPAFRRLRGAQGFTLLETLVAVAVVAALLAVLPRTLVEARNNIEQSHHWLHARLAAESILAEEPAAIETLPGVYRGRSHGRDWVLRIEQAGAPEPENNDARLYLMQLTVEIAEGRSLSVETLRSGRAR